MSKSSLRQYINGLDFNPNYNPDADVNIFTLQFQNPTVKSKEETRSKFLLPESEFNFFILDCENKLKHSGIRFDNKLPPHVEILSQHELSTLSKEDATNIFKKRVAFLEGTKIDISDSNNYKMIGGKRFVLTLPSHPEIGLKDPYLTIAYVNFLSNKERFLKIILDSNYSTENNWE